MFKKVKMPQMQLCTCCDGGGLCPCLIVCCNYLWKQEWRLLLLPLHTCNEMSIILPLIIALFQSVRAVCVWLCDWGELHGRPLGFQWAGLSTCCWFDFSYLFTLRQMHKNHRLGFYIICGVTGVILISDYSYKCDDIALTRLTCAGFALFFFALSKDTVFSFSLQRLSKLTFRYCSSIGTAWY